MLADFKRKKSSRPDYLLFIKWDRFSRNAADAYQMIRLLKDYNIEPQAIEQPLDLSIPENKMMLAFYLAASEVENDRRALNVIHGMRRAKKEGRWMGTAPIGYANRTNESGVKYISLNQPHAEIMKWAFIQIAEGKYNTQQVWKEIQKQGLICSNSNFRQLLRNLIYYGKIYIPKLGNEPAHLVDGQHEAIITEEIYIKAQLVLDNRRSAPIKRKFTVPHQLVLRGFLNCPKCDRLLTGSASTGQYSRYHYYHCQNPCSYRKRADHINDIFLEELFKWKPRGGFLPVFTAVLKERYESKMYQKIIKRKTAIEQCEIEHSKFIRAQDLLLTNALTVADFQEIKDVHESKLKELQQVIVSHPDYLERFGLSIHNKGNALLRLYDFFSLANTKNKRLLVGKMFPSNLYFNHLGFQIKRLGSAINLIYRYEKV